MNTKASDNNVLGKARPKSKIVFSKNDTNGFQREVQQEVNAYFRDKGISKKANASMKLKSILIITGWIGTYAFLISNIMSPMAMLFLALFHGFFAALIGLNIGHDAIHGSYSKNSKNNKRLGILFNLLGANDYVWSIMHNIVHHTYTNIPEYDGDINQVPILRMEPTQERWKIHRFQHIYAFILYCWSTLLWVFIKDYKKFFKHQLGGHYRERFPKKEIIRLFTYKAIYYFVFMVVPFLVIDLNWYQILLGIVLAHFVEGFTLTIIFMLAHVIENTSYPIPNKENEVQLPWADMQLYTTSNFATNNKVVNYLFGGLNFQVEHHLFPKICHIHYPKIAGIVKKTALKHSLPYLEQPTFFGAIASHIRVLKKFGAPEQSTS